jgi:MFS transporter, AAHS family, 3-hydroxyphenylpropionic acid transporter
VVLKEPEPGRDGAALTVVLCCLTAFAEGIDLQAPGLTAPVLGALYNMSPADKGWFLSMSTFGLMVGAILGGRLSDRMSRKGTLILSAAVFGLFSLATALASSVHMLMALRFLTGLGLGGALPNTIALAAEAVGSGRRHTAIGFLYASLPFGGGAASLISAVASAPGQWPVVYVVGGITPLLIVPLLALLLPGSRPAAGGGRVPVGIAAALFGESRAAPTLLLWIGFFCVLLIMYLLLGWLPSLMLSRGLSRAQAFIVQVAFNWLGACGSVGTGLLLDRGRKIAVTTVVFLAAAAALAGLASAPGQFPLALLAAAAVGIGISGTQAVLYSLAPLCYPARVRGTGVGFAVAAGRVGSAAGPLLAGVLVGAGRSAGHVLATLVPLITVAAAAVLVVILMQRRPQAEF